MKSTAIITTAIITTAILLSCTIAEGQYAGHNRATHIIKLKSTMNMTTAHDFILANHRAYTLSQNGPNAYLRKKRRSLLSTKKNNKNDIPEAIEGYDTIFSATGMGPKLFLDSLTVDQSFTAVTGIFPDEHFIDYLHQQNNVDYVETNQVYKAQMLRPLQDYQLTNNTNIHTYTQKVHQMVTSNKKRGALQTAASPNWGQARISQHARGDLQKYTYDESAGEGVHVYVLDTGVNVAHADFEGRAKIDANFVETEDENDLGGHGTHVAGKIAGRLYGIAKKVNIHSVKILDKSGDGTTSSLIKGISHVIKVAQPGKTLINLSLSGPKSRLIDDIISKAVLEHNIPVFVSSGNAATDACFFSPASNPNVFSVGASDPNDDVPTYSDVGQCVKLYAPGSEIESTWIGSLDATKILDGTSMANPHVSGIAATLLSRKSYTSVQELYNDVSNLGTQDTLSFKWSKESSPSTNLLAYLDIV